MAARSRENEDTRLRGDGKGHLRIKRGTARPASPRKAHASAGRSERRKRRPAAPTTNGQARSDGADVHDRTPRALSTQRTLLRPTFRPLRCHRERHAVYRAAPALRQVEVAVPSDNPPTDPPAEPTGVPAGPDSRRGARALAGSAPCARTITPPHEPTPCSTATGVRYPGADTGAPGRRRGARSWSSARRSGKRRRPSAPTTVPRTSRRPLTRQEGQQAPALHAFERSLGGARRPALCSASSRVSKGTIRSRPSGARKNRDSDGGRALSARPGVLARVRRSTRDDGVTFAALANRSATPANAEARRRNATKRPSRSYGPQGSRRRTWGVRGRARSSDRWRARSRGTWSAKLHHGPPTDGRRPRPSGAGRASG